VSLSESFITSRSLIAEEIPMQPLREGAKEVSNEKKCRLKIKKKPAFDSPF